MTTEREMPFEWRGWITHVCTLLNRQLSEAEMERAKEMFFAKECPSYAAHDLHYHPKDQ